ncbi:glutathione hydrolase 1 proenzyme-like isoform X1 [Clytia hemisphaerica]|uniref:Uncharacterized protein n=1 Tax=Clytia hemisphaerica TaxID=252671 RepID=A0A7M5X870_9CNID
MSLHQSTSASAARYVALSNLSGNARVNVREPSSSRERSSRKIVVGVITLVLLIAVILVVVFATRSSSSSGEPVIPDTHYEAGSYANAGVAADHTVCSDIGAKILEKNGSIADSAIATTLCAGVANPFSCGIGGGGFLVYYEKAKKKFHVYDYRETAPSKANETMYANISSTIGAQASGIPGEIAGMWDLHKDFGNLPWKDLVEPSIKLASEGIVVNAALEKAIQVVVKKMKDKGVDMSGLKKLITHKDGTYLKEGDTYVNERLAETLRVIQKDGKKSFYEGDIAKNMTNDIIKNGGVWVQGDMANYTVAKRETFTLKLSNGYTINSMPLPGGGPIVGMIHNIISGYDFSKLDISKDDNDAFEFWQKLIESMKFSYAQRGLFGDPGFVPTKNITDVMNIIKDLQTGVKIRQNKIRLNETHNSSYYGGFWGKDDFGTSHTSILTKEGDAIATTNTINTYFGSLFVSESTGIIMNNEMDDFSTPGKINAFGYPPSPANFIRPFKRPMSSMSPTIVTDDNGDVKMVAGASGGSRIISGTATIIAKYLYLNMKLGDAVASYRLHNQGVPNRITYNKNKQFAPKSSLIDRLRHIGHVVQGGGSDCVTQAVVKDGDHLLAMSDPRKVAKASGY